MRVGVYCVGTMEHRVYRMPGFLSLPRNEVSHPHTIWRVTQSPPLGPREETHLLEGEGVGEPNSDEGTDALVCMQLTPLRYRSVKYCITVSL